MSAQQFREYDRPRRSVGAGVMIGAVITVLVVALALALAALFEVFPFGGSASEDSPPVFTEIQDLNQLTTTRWIGQVVVTAEAEPGRIERIADIVGIDASALTGESVIISATGEVEAGVDLDAIEEGDVVVNGETVNLTLPRAEVLSTSLDEERTGVYDRDRGLFVYRGDDSIIEEGRRDAESRIEDSALESGILEQAETNAEASLTSFVESLGFEEVNVSFR